MMKPSATHNRGFTLIELIVATTLLTIVMTALYVGFGNMLRIWKYGEAMPSTRTRDARQSDSTLNEGRNAMSTFQDTRNALSQLSRELGCMLGGAEHLFQGKDDEIEFFTVAPPMNVKKGEDARVLWVKYRLKGGGKRKTLIREEAVVQKPLPLRTSDDQEIDHTRIKLETKKRFELIVDDVEDLKFTYYWIPPYEQKPDEPPKWLEPIELKESREGWGLPQGIKAELTVNDQTSSSGKATFPLRVSFRGPTTPYNEKRIGALGGGSKL